MRRKKPVGLYSAVAIGVGAMVGAGIFSVMGVACYVSGNATFISFGIAGVVTLLCAYSYAKLAATYPSAGGPVEFLVRGYGEGVVVGFNIFLWVTYIIG